MANTPLLSPEQDQDEAFNKGQQDYESRIAGISDAEKNPSTPDKTDTDDSPWNTNVTPDGKKEGGVKRLTKDAVLTFAKKRGGLIGILAALGIGGGILGTIFGPASMLFNLMDNIDIQNDSAGTAIERRFIKVFANMTNPENSDAFCANSTKNIKCRMGRISNKALHQLSKKGVTPFEGEWDGSKKGYPAKNPTGYVFDDGTGNPKSVQAKDLEGFLNQKENRKFAAKILGVGGAFNMKTKIWLGKHFGKKLVGKFKLGRDGGVADGKNSAQKTAAERATETLEKTREKIPGMENVDSISSSITEKAKKHLGKAKKGGGAYMTAVAGCIAVRAPGYIAAGVAAIQLAQVMPYFVEYIAGPTSKARQNAIGSNFTGEDMDAVGTVLTEKVNGKSALDSAALLAVMGVNKAKAPVSSSVTPGYSIITNPVVKEARELEGASEAQCNAILSPTAMYTAMAVDIATTAALSTTFVGGLLKGLASLAVSEVASRVAAHIVQEAAKGAITDLAENDAIPKARGQELGDAIGVSASAVYATSGLSRHLPVLSQSDLTEFTALKEESEQFQKELAVASLSPFDTSSRHTFLGSIIYNAGAAMVANGGSTSFLSTIKSFASLSFSALTPQAGAATISTAYGGYAADFGLETGDPSTTPCITISGLPCTGITAAQAAMSTDTAISLLQSEGWLETDMSAADTAITDELIGAGIKKDTPLSEFMETCSNPEEGDYLYTAAGCTVPRAVQGAAGAGGSASFENEAGETVNMNDVQNDVGGDEAANLGVDNPASLTAMAPFLIDYQIVQSVNGEDEENGGEKEPTNTSNEGVVYFGQCDRSSDWWSLPYGPGTNNACLNACGPTSMAIIVASLTGNAITPRDAINNSVSFFGGSGNVNYGDNTPQIQFAEANGLKNYGGGAIDEAIEFVKSGKGMALINSQGAYPSTSTGHVLALVGVTDDGLLRVADPFASESSSPNKQEVGEYTKEHMASIGFNWTKIGK